jgi:hypothetical protein
MHSPSQVRGLFATQTIAEQRTGNQSNLKWQNQIGTAAPQYRPTTSQALKCRVLVDGYMGAGEAPPVKGEDVMILVGASIILITFIIQFWVSPVILDAGQSFTVEQDLSEGAEISIEVKKGKVDVDLQTPSGDTIQHFDQSSDLLLETTESGIYVVTITAVEDSSIFVEMGSDIIASLVLFILGAGILGFGLWKRAAIDDDEPMEAILE